MPTNGATIWAAAAASFSALSAFLIYRIQVANLRFSARPDIVLEKWERGLVSGSSSERISFSELENIGNGTAQHIYINSFANNESKYSTYGMGTLREPVLAKDKKVSVKGDIFIYWDNVEPQYDGQKYLGVKIKIYYWDIAGMRHAKLYSLFIVKDTKRYMASNSIATGVDITMIKTFSTPVWKLKLYGKLTKIPKLGKYFIDEHV